LGHSTDVEQIDRCDSFVDGVLCGDERLEGFDLLLLTSHELIHLLRVELSHVADRLDEIVLSKSERVFEFCDLFENQFFECSLPEFELRQHGVKFAACVSYMADVQLVFLVLASLVDLVAAHPCLCCIVCVGADDLF